MKSYLACLSIVCLSYFPTFLTELLCWAKLVFATQGRFFVSRTSCGTTFEAVFGQAEVDLILKKLCFDFAITSPAIVYVKMKSCWKLRLLLCKLLKLIAYTKKTDRK